MVDTLREGERLLDNRFASSWSGSVAYDMLKRNASIIQPNLLARQEVISSDTIITPTFQDSPSCTRRPA